MWSWTPVRRGGGSLEWWVERGKNGSSHGLITLQLESIATAFQGRSPRPWLTFVEMALSQPKDTEWPVGWEAGDRLWPLVRGNSLEVDRLDLHRKWLGGEERLVIPHVLLVSVREWETAVVCHVS